MSELFVPLGPVRSFWMSTWRTFVFSLLGGALVGAASGAVFTPIGLVIGLLLGLALGAVSGVLTCVAVAAGAGLDRDLRPSAARTLFCAPPVMVFALLAFLGGPAISFLPGGESGIVAAVFGLSSRAAIIGTPLLALVTWFAGPWCLAPLVPSMRHPKAFRRMVYAAAVPAAVAGLATTVWALVFLWVMSQG